MIIFSFVSKEKLPDNFPEKYPDVLKFEGEFCITVDHKKFFNDPNFSIFEFLLFIKQWIKNKDKSINMEYISQDTDENPLISFTNKNGLWKIHSPWQCFDCKNLFSRDELERSVTDLMDKLL